jgi:hypothetical protein
MALGADGFREIVSLVDPNGIPVTVIAAGGGIYRLAVDAALAAGSGFSLRDGNYANSGISASIKDDNVAPGPNPNDGGLLISGVQDVAPGVFTQRWLRVNALGQLTPAETPNRPAVFFGSTTVLFAGTPVQCTNAVVPDGLAAVVVFRESQAGNPVGYIANSMANCLVAGNRTELLKGSTRKFYITNTNLLWFDATVNGSIFDVIVEQ